MIKIQSTIIKMLSISSIDFDQDLVGTWQKTANKTSSTKDLIEIKQLNDR